MRCFIKKIIIFSMLTAVLLTTVSCEKKAEESLYQQYVKSLIAMNYLGATSDYIAATGSSEENANTIYEGNISYLTNNIISYYNLQIDNAPEVRSLYEELAKKVYGKINYTVSPAYKYGSVYLVDVTIYPIDLFNQSASRVRSYIESFNNNVASGKYNDYELAAYESEFASGLCVILSEECDSMTYADPLTLTVEIVEEDDTYYLRDRDFLNIDAAMINTTITSVPESTESPESAVTESPAGGSE